MSSSTTEVQFDSVLVERISHALTLSEFVLRRESASNQTTRYTVNSTHHINKQFYLIFEYLFISNTKQLLQHIDKFGCFKFFDYYMNEAVQHVAVPQNQKRKENTGHHVEGDSQIGITRQDIGVQIET